MKNLIKSLSSDWYLMRHSKIIWIHVIVPVLGIVLFLCYYSYSPLNESNKISLFIQAVAIAYPFLIAIVTTMLYEQELNAGNLQQLFMVPFSRWIIHGSKIILITMLSLGSCLLTVLGFGIAFRLFGYRSYPVSVFFRIALLLFVFQWGIYLIQYMVAFTWGQGVSLGLGVIGTLLSPLLSLGLGDGIWKFIPYGWGIRITSYYLVIQTETTKMDGIKADYRKGIVNALFITGILLIIFMIWSVTWQGGKVDEKND